MMQEICDKDFLGFFVCWLIKLAASYDCTENREGSVKKQALSLLFPSSFLNLFFHNIEISYVVQNRK